MFAQSSKMSWACEVIYKGRLWPFFGEQRKKGVRAGFERVSLSQLPWLYTCAVYLTKDSGMAEELVKDTYLEAYRRCNSNEAGANCRVWLLSILRKIFIHRYRKRVGEPEIINWQKLDQDDGLWVEWGMKREEGTSQNPSISQFSDGEVEEAVKKLPEEYRLALILVDIEELSYQEAARVMDCTINRLRSRLSRGRRMLQVVLRNDVRPRGRIEA
jgi:RNA polymerase sigma-70 factor (ECF subfamily)